MEIQSQDSKYLEAIAQAKKLRVQLHAKGERKKSPNLIELSNDLDRYYFLNKLQIYCEYLSYRSIVGENYLNYSKADILLWQEIINITKSWDEPIFRIYQCISRALDSGNIEEKTLRRHFKIALTIIQENESLFTNEEVLSQYSMLNNYVIRRINEGLSIYHEVFLKVNIRLLQLRYENVESQLIPLEPGWFKNIVVAALNIQSERLSWVIGSETTQKRKSNELEKFEWLENFVQTYEVYLAEDSSSQSHLIYCKALLALEKGRPEEAYEILDNKMRVQGTFINLNVKILHLKILYDIFDKKANLLEYDKIEIRKVFDAYRKLLKSEIDEKGILSYQLEFYQGFYDCFKLLWKFYQSFNGVLNNRSNPRFKTKRLEIIELLNKKHYSFKPWILAKLEAIK